MLSLGPVLVASFIVMGAIAAAFALGIRALNRRVARADAESAAATGEDPSAGPYRAAPPAPGSAGSRELAPLYYILSVLFWPAGFIIGGYLLRDARTARIGRTCMLIAMGLVTAVSALTCIGVVSGAILVQRRHREERLVQATPRPLDRPTARPPVRPSYNTGTTPTVVAGHLGEPVVLGDLVVQVHAVEADFAPTPLPARDVGSRFVTFDVSFRNEGTRVITTGSHSIKLFDADGFLATSQFSGAKKPQLSYVSLTPGNVVRGWVTFKLPTSAKPGRLQILLSGGGPSRVAEISLSNEPR